MTTSAKSPTRNAAHARDDAAAREHRLAEHCLARRSVTDNGEVTDVSRSVIFHSGISFNLETVEPATARDSKERGPLEAKCKLAKAGRGQAAMVCMGSFITDAPPG